MPRESEIEKLVPKLYKQSALNLLMFGYVAGVRGILDSVTIKDAIQLFMDDYDLTHDDINIDTAANTFNRMQNFKYKKNTNT